MRRVKASCDQGGGSGCVSRIGDGGFISNIYYSAASGLSCSTRGPHCVMRDLCRAQTLAVESMDSVVVAHELVALEACGGA